MSTRLIFCSQIPNSYLRRLINAFTRISGLAGATSCSGSSDRLLRLWKYRDLPFLPVLFSAMPRLSMNLQAPLLRARLSTRHRGEAAISQRPFRKRNTHNNNMYERMAKSGWTIWWCKSNPFAEDLLENKRIWISTLGNTVEKTITCPGANVLTFTVQLFVDKYRFILYRLILPSFRVRWRRVPFSTGD